MSAPTPETDQSMSSVATQSKVLVGIANMDASIEQVVRLAATPRAAHQSPETRDRADAQHECRLAELDKRLIGVSPPVAAIRRLILEIAPTRASVMIYGESGTGKKL